jgi:diguanylate cyclase (GGDEF)-like protein/PAS domain S-box-containing protein
LVHESPEDGQRRPVEGEQLVATTPTGDPGHAPVVDLPDLRSAFDNAPSGMAVLTPDGVVLASNRALSRLLGRAPSELVGRTLFEVTHPEDLASASESCWRMRTTDQEVLRHECRLVHRDGSTVEVLVSTAQVAARPGRPAHLIMHLQDIGERKALEAEIVHRSLHDPLTGLANRALLFDRLSHALARADRTASPTCLFLLDLDGFKQVNDTHGHAAGDELLQQFAARLSGVLRPGDTAARLGGDEFVVLCEDTSQAQAQVISERLRAAAAWPFDLPVGRVAISASVGISTSADPSDDPAELVRRADVSMYAVKRSRRTA